MDLAGRLAEVKAGIAAACDRAGRNASDVRLVAVSKFHPEQAIREAIRAGQVDFGENYAQEAEAKKSALAADWPELRWHMTGHVQSRKASLIAGAYSLVHTLDSIKLADALEKNLDSARQRVLIEVNIADEAQKAGVPASQLERLAKHVQENCPHLELLGMMCLPPVFDNGGASRPFFARLRNLRDELEQKLGIALPELSMGMSGDYPAAIEEGATIVRIGTAIFGPRPSRQPLTN